MAALPDEAGDLFDPIERASFDPTPAGKPLDEPPRWWGNHLAEMRWQAELARLLVDPVYFGRGVPRGDGTAVLTIPGFMAGDSSLSVMRDWLGPVRYRARRPRHLGHPGRPRRGGG